MSSRHPHLQMAFLQRMQRVLEDIYLQRGKSPTSSLLWLLILMWGNSVSDTFQHLHCQPPSFFLTHNASPIMSLCNCDSVMDGWGKWLAIILASWIVVASRALSWQGFEIGLWILTMVNPSERNEEGIYVMQKDMRIQGEQDCDSAAQFWTFIHT